MPPPSVAIPPPLHVRKTKGGALNLPLAASSWYEKTMVVMMCFLRLQVLENPLPNVVGRPLDENIFVWHVNVRAEDDSNQLSGGVFHINLVFPPNYPNEGPTLYIGSPLPHPNIYRASSSGNWQLSLWDCIPGFKGWSSAYSAQSILLQLQTFLLREDLQYHSQNVSGFLSYLSC